MNQNTKEPFTGVYPRDTAFSPRPSQKPRSGCGSSDAGLSTVLGRRPFETVGPSFSAAAGVPLENVANIFSGPAEKPAPEPAYREKFRLLDWLRQLPEPSRMGEPVVPRGSVRSRQRQCMLAAVSDSVGIVERAAGGMAYNGLQTCGSITCPWCGPHIGAARRDEIALVVEAHRALGGKVLFGTLTLRHSKGQSHKLLADAVQKCWWRATGGRGWLRDREAFKIDGTIRVTETKRNEKAGWHVHVHFLVLVSADAPALPSQLMGSMFARWSAAAVKLGLRAPLWDGQEMHEVNGEQAAKNLGGYFAKEAVEHGAAGAKDLSRDMTAGHKMGWELTNAEGKTSGTSVTPGELLTLAADGDTLAAGLFNEYELSMKGRRTIAWSRGLREMFALGEMLDDKATADAAEAGELGGSSELVRIPARVFGRLARMGLRSAALDRITTHGVDGLLLWIEFMGADVVREAETFLDPPIPTADLPF